MHLCPRPLRFRGTCGQGARAPHQAHSWTLLVTWSTEFNKLFSRRSPPPSCMEREFAAEQLFLLPLEEDTAG